MNTPNTVALVLALALAVSAAAVRAGPPPEDMPPQPPRMAAGERAPQAAQPNAASETRLAATRGGDAATSNQASLAGTVTGNSAINVTTGANTIDSGSFANASGMPMVIQNSGANVLIQNATVINLQLK